MEHYSLALVRAAVIAQLPALQVSFSKSTEFKHHDTASFFFPKLNLSMEQLKQLTPGHEGGRHHPSLQDLKLALQSARQLGEVKITSFEKQNSHNLIADSSKESLTKKTIKEPEQIGLLFSLQATELEDPSPLLKKRCRWAPLTWSVNPKRLVYKLTKKDLAKDSKVILYRKNLELTGKLKDIPHKALLPNPEEFKDLQYLAWRPEEKHESKLLGLKNGVAYPLELPSLAKQVFCLIDCHELEIDPSKSEFISNEALKNKLTIIQEAAKHAQSLLK